MKQLKLEIWLSALGFALIGMTAQSVEAAQGSQSDDPYDAWSQRQDGPPHAAGLNTHGDPYVSPASQPFVDPPRRGPGLRMGMGGPDRPGDGPGPHGRGLGYGPGGPGGPPDGGPPMLAPAEIDEFLGFADRHFPQLHEQLVQARDIDEEAFRRMLRRIAPPMTRLMRMARENPEEAERIIHFQKTEMMIREQQRRLLSSRSEQQKAEARSELRRLLEERFDMRLERLRAEIDELRRRIDEQTRRLAEQDRNKQEIIEEELAALAELPGGRGPRGRGHFPSSRPADPARPAPSRP